MKRKTLCAVAAFVVGISVVAAQETKTKTLTTIGPVTKIAGDSLTVDTGKGLLVFVTTNSTKVKVTGGGSKAQAAKQAGEKGVKITETVHEGDQVSVKYNDVGGKLMASEIDVKQRRPQNALPVK
jgi:hypothetical protein